MYRTFEHLLYDLQKRNYICCCEVNKQTNKRTNRSKQLYDIEVHANDLQQLLQSNIHNCHLSTNLEHAKKRK